MEKGNRWKRDGTGVKEIHVPTTVTCCKTPIEFFGQNLQHISQLISCKAISRRASSSPSVSKSSQRHTALLSLGKQAVTIMSALVAVQLKDTHLAIPDHRCRSIQRPPLGLRNMEELERTGRQSVMSSTGRVEEMHLISRDGGKRFSSPLRESMSDISNIVT